MTAKSGNRNSTVFTAKGRFQPGNPGKPKGARNKATVMLEAMFDGEAGEIGRKVIELAKEGRLEAIKLVLERACPRNSRTVRGLKLPPLKSAADAVTAMTAITAGVSSGAITVQQARDLTDIVDSFRKTHELAELERRVVALEEEAARGQAAP